MVVAGLGRVELREYANAEVCRYQENGAGIVAVGSLAESGVPRRSGH
jgi:hypothetical protein